MLDNCIDALKDIENEYKDDHVKIRIRLREFTAPQYLIAKIKQQINELIIEKSICRFQQIDNSIVLTNEQRRKIYQIARNNHCQIETIEIKFDVEVYTIPNAPLSESQSDQSHSWMSARKISILNSSIEIYLTNQSNSIPVRFFFSDKTLIISVSFFVKRDFTVVSSPDDATEAEVQFLSDYGYVELKTGRKMLFLRWSPIVEQNDDKTNKKLKRSIDDFLSSVFQSVTTYNGNEGKIVFLTNGWENVGTQQKQFVEFLINKVKKELELRKVKWRIMLMFNNQQIEFYKEFYQQLQQLNSNIFAQFSRPISSR